MPEFLVPTYISDPPIDKGCFDAAFAVGRWLADLGEDAGGAFSETMDKLAARLGTSQDRIQSILEEAIFESGLKITLRDFFEPVPHETEVREQLESLTRRTRDLPRTPSGGRQSITPHHVQSCLETCRPPLPDALAAEWRAWDAAWNAVVARNPPLELRRRMKEVFDNDSAGAAFGWVFGKERWFYEWVARGRRDPMPFADTHGIITEAYYSRLCELRELAAGWWCYDEEVERLRFVSLAEWETMSAKLDGLLDRHR